MLGHERPGGGHYSAKRGFIIRSYSSKNREQEEGHTVTVTVGVRGPKAVSEVDDELNGARPTVNCKVHERERARVRAHFKTRRHYALSLQGSYKRERERGFIDNHKVTEGSVSTTPCRVTPPLGARAPALTASTLPPLSFWPCGPPRRVGKHKGAQTAIGPSQSPSRSLETARPVGRASALDLCPWAKVSGVSRHSVRVFVSLFLFFHITNCA
jgi:hypothetical protein